MQDLASSSKAAGQQQGLARLHRRLQRLQDERIHLEGVLAHERGLLAQQQADNALLRLQLAGVDQQNANSMLLQSSPASNVQGQVTHHHNVDASAVQQLQQEQHTKSLRRDSHSHSMPGTATDKACGGQSERQHDGQHGPSDWSRHNSLQLENQLLQLQAELAMLDSERCALHSNLKAQQAQHDSECAALHSQLFAERQDREQVSEEMNRLLVGDGAWQSRAVHWDAQLANVVSELHDAHAQCSVCHEQVCLP